MFWMLVVETIAKIRRLSLVQGKSIKTICRELKISRNVLRKGNAFGRDEDPLRAQAPASSRMGAWLEKLDVLLSVNAAKPQRERLTLIRDFEELRGLRYDGSYSSVWRHAQTLEADRGSAAAGAYIPLSFAPGEAYQFDWSHEIALLDDVTVTVKVAHMRLGHEKVGGRDALDERIISLHAHGSPVRDIQRHLHELYRAKVSPDLISRVTDAVLHEVKEWQNRPLDRKHPA